jgi:hypothetical protein
MTAISNSTLNPWLSQFQLTGFPNGIDHHGSSLIGLSYQVTSAQLLALNTTAISLVPAPNTSALISTPPNGYVYAPIRALAEYVAGTTAYTLAGTSPALTVVYHGQTTALLNLLVTGFLNETTNEVLYTNAVSPSGPFAFSACQNLGLDLILGGTGSPALTLGNGLVNLYLLYGVFCLL